MEKKSRDVEVIDPLTDQEQARLGELENIVVKGLRGPFDCGFALREILENRLYRESHGSFDVYVERTFKFSRQTAYRLINAANVLENVTHGLQNQSFGADVCPTLPLPSNERQVRPLTKISPDEQLETWQEVVRSAPKGKVTSAHVNKVVRTRLGMQVHTRGRKVRDEINNDDALPDTFKSIYDQMVVLLVEARNDNWKSLPKDKAARAVKGLFAFLEG